jgi:5'-phosphate synthase pdxT subunit
VTVATIGVLAVQGAFAAHARAVERLGHHPRRLRAAEDFDGLDGIVLPGGESTVQRDLVGRLGLRARLCDALRRLPVLATCAGLILAAREVDGVAEEDGVLDVAVLRNAWGRQVDSFEADSDEGLRLVFIRAPRIVRVGADVRVLQRLDGEPVLVRQGRLFAATFHPELTDSLAIHRAAFGDLSEHEHELV